jgi:PPP family 3-phenylpropionic acid transporter
MFATVRPAGPLFLPKSIYFLYYAAAACLMPYLTLYYAQEGMSGRQIGVLTGVVPLMTMIAAPAWSGLADATQRHRGLLLLAMILTLAGVFLLSIAPAFGWLILAAMLYAFAVAPVMPLVDNTVVAMLGERRNEYGRQRLWGAVGWGLAAPLAGVLIDRAGLGLAFYGYLLVMAGCMVAASRLPVSRATISTRFWSGVRVLLANRRWVIFLATILIGGISLTIELNFLFLFLKDLGAGQALMGLSLTFATLSELPVWFFAGRMIERWGTRRLLIVSLLACALQPLLYSLIRDPWLALPIQLLHGLAFSAMWAAGVAYAAEIAPEGLGATAQGVFTGVAMGLRSALGAVVGGVLYDSVGAVGAFRWGAVAAVIGLVFFLVMSRGSIRPGAPAGELVEV